MWKQINLGVEIAAGVADLVLLLRVLGLKLHRTYLFVTLACTLSVLFDAATLFFPTDRVWLYTEIFSTCVCPLAVWSIFDEIPEVVANLRRLAMMRMLGGLIIISIIGLIWLSYVADVPDETGLLFTATLQIFVSLSISASCLSYLWIMRRGIKLFKITQGRNTQTWMFFFAATLAVTFLSCFIVMIRQSIGEKAGELFGNISVLVLNTCLIVVTLWCVSKLRGLSKDLPVSAPESEPPA